MTNLDDDNRILHLRNEIEALKSRVSGHDRFALIYGIALAVLTVFEFLI